MRSSEYPNAYRYRRIVRAKRYIDQHFDEPIDLEAISGEARFSKYHFLRLFKDAYGKTPWQYLAELRVRHAAELLEEDRYTVTKICFMVGFESVGSFSTLFKKVVGLSPALEITLMPAVPGMSLDEDQAGLLQELIGKGVFECNDIYATFEELKSKGVEFKKAPKEEFYGIEAIFKDPFGNRFSLTQRK